MAAEELQQLVLTEYAYAAFLGDPSRLALWEELGLTMAQLRVLYIVREEQDATAGRIADRLGVRASTGTGIADRLVAQGLVERQGDEQDRRVVRILLTPLGEQVIGEITAASRAFIGTILRELDDHALRKLVLGLVALNREAQRMGLQIPRDLPASDASPS